MKILCVAEKPSIAKSVANILSTSKVTTRNTKVKYIKNYDFQFNFGGNLGTCEVTMTSVLGHLTATDFPSNYSWGKCDPFELFSAPVVTKYGKLPAGQIADNIKREASKCSKLMIWTDCDREGEYIGYEIVKAGESGNSLFKITKETNNPNILRAQFSHLERTHILNAAKNPKQLDLKQVNAVGTRIEIDLRSGYAFTRLLSNFLQSRVSANNKNKDKKTISYGTCQFPTLGFVVDRYKRVRLFISEPFWRIHVITLKDKIKTEFNWQKPNMFDHMAATVLYANCLSSSTPQFGTITNKILKQTSNYKPLPLTTVELQKIASRVYKLGAKETLTLAEELYQKGFISYPRTETDLFPAKMDLKKLIEPQKQHPVWGSFAQSLLDESKYSAPRTGKHNDEAHPPIHPITFTNGSQLSAKSKKIYELVVRHFLACCSQDAKGSMSTVYLRWGDEVFTTSALEVLELNYLEVYAPYKSWNSTSGKKIPNFTVGEQVKLSKTELKQGKTTPPEYLTESELISLMDANGIGTDATIAEHIDKIIQREYIKSVRKGKKTILVPSELGMALVQGFENIDFGDRISLTKPFLRKNLEQQLLKICNGGKLSNQVLLEIVHLYEEAYNITMRNKLVITNSYDEVRRENSSNY